MPYEKVDLLGVWSGSWEGYSATSPGMRVQVGMGIVTPAERLVEFLNSDPLKENSERWFAGVTAAQADRAGA